MADVADRAHWEVLIEAAGVDPAGRLAAILPAAAIRPHDLAEAVEPWSLEPPRGRAHRWHDGFGPEATLTWLDNVRPSCVFADPRSVERLVAAAQPGRIAIDAILVWRPAGSKDLGPACRRVFGARLVEAVASDLCGFVAFPCGTGGFAPGLETAVAEVVDGQGRPWRTRRAGAAACRHRALRLPSARHPPRPWAHRTLGSGAGRGAGPRPGFRIIR